MEQKIDRLTLQELFLEALNGVDYCFIEGSNPFRILLNGKEYWIYIKNLTSAHFDNKDIWRAQLPHRDDFNSIKESDIDFILLGYDGENDVYATWNPIWVKQRLNDNGNVSFYSRLSLQQQVRQKKQFKRLQLNNDGEVVVFPRENTRMFFINVQSYFLAVGDYVAVGSKRRPTTTPRGSCHKVFQEPSHHDWEAEYTDSNGKLTRIANPQLIDRLRPYLDTDYKKTAAAFNAIDSFYGNRFPQMEISDWGKLINDIDWSAPYPHNNPAVDTASGNRPNDTRSPKRSKKYTLKVEFPDGRILQNPIVCETYAAAIKAVDPELVELIGLSHAGVGIVSKVLDPKYAKYQKPIGDGWYVMTNSSTRTKYADLQTISDELELDLKISLIPLKGPVETARPRIKVPEGTRSRIRITFPDGRIICPVKVMESLVEVVEYAGARRVHELDITCCGENLILKNPGQRYRHQSKPVGDGWFCNTCSNTPTKFLQINEISTRLSLGLKVEMI